MFSTFLPSIYRILVCLMVLTGLAVQAADTEGDAIETTSEFLPLSLEELMDQDVTSLARKEQTVKETPSAAFVITSEDIRRSGATNLPDILRMVPGMDVGKINAWNAGVSARGFNDLYANKLQVMVDGRTIYDPLTSGVSWGQQNPFLKDIQRIEVIRGPSGTLWGANAVNGTINIITRSAADTQGGLVSAGAGNKEQSGGVRYGSKLADNTYLRGSTNGVYRDANVDATGKSTNDFGNAETVNFRLDSQLNSQDKLMLEGDFSNYKQNGYFVGVSSATPPLWTPNDFGKTGVNSSLQGYWTHQTETGHDWKLNMAFTYTDWRQIVDQMSRTSYVLDFQDSLPVIGRHNLLWGANFQTTSDQFQNSLTLAFKPDNFTQNNSGIFVQDQIDLSKDLKLTLANRVEHFTYTGWETEPNIRLLWKANKIHSLWGAISRSVVVPNRAQHSINLFTPVPGMQTPFLLAIANPQMKTENLLAFELGWRWQAAKNIDVDTALFYNIYDRMQGTVITSTSYSPIYGEILYAQVGNYRQVKSYGVELALNHRINHRWRLQTSYSAIGFDTSYNNSLIWLRDPLAEKNYDPQQLMSIRSQFDVSNDVEFDVWGRYVDQIHKDRVNIPSYFGLDVRLGWHPLKNLELSLSGQNLLYNQHPEFSDILYYTVASQIQRSYFCQISWQF